MSEEESKKAEEQRSEDEEEEEDQAATANPSDTAGAKKKKKKKKKKKANKGEGVAPSADAEPSSTAVATSASVQPQAAPAQSAAALTPQIRALLEARMKELEAQKKEKEELPVEKRPHPFWDNQPVPRFGTDIETEGPLEADKSEIRQTPYNLPAGFAWCEIDITNPAELTELYELLAMHYVADAEAKFRFDYSREFLKWALAPPGWLKTWHCGVRFEKNNKLYAFISAVPAHMRVVDKLLMVEINFLCAHTKIRSKRIAPVLIAEITRRVHLQGIFQASYTSGTLIPRPISSSRYFHRTINTKKLVECGFSGKGSSTMAQLINKNALPSTTSIPGLRQMTDADIPAVFPMLKQHLSKFKLAPDFTEEEVTHYFRFQKDVLYCYVVEDPESHNLTAMTSFYALPSSISGCAQHTRLLAAYSYYNAITPDFKEDLQEGFDVYNCLDLMENQSFITPLDFGRGDGLLHYYLYNYAVKEFPTQLNGLILF